MDEKYLKTILKKFKSIVTVEEGVTNGGFGSGVSGWLTDNNYTGGLKIIGIPNEFIPHGNRDILLKEIDLDRSGIVKKIKEFLNN